MLGISIKPGDREVQEWLTDHDLDPGSISNNVVFADDGDVILEQYVKDTHGRVRLHPADNDSAWRVQVRVSPSRPFPLPR